MGKVQILNNANVYRFVIYCLSMIGYVCVFSYVAEGAFIDNIATYWLGAPLGMVWWYFLDWFFKGIPIILGPDDKW